MKIIIFWGSFPSPGDRYHPEFFCSDWYHPDYGKVSGCAFCGVFAVIIGVNIGDCITTFIVSRIGAKPEQIRTALVHVIYNVIAALLIITAVTILRLTGILNDTIWNMTLNSGGVANLHGVFRLVPAILLLPFSGALAGLAEKLVPDREMHDEDAEIENNLRELDSRLISNPTLALDQVSHLIRHMADVSIHNYDSAVDMIGNYDDKRMSRIKERENLLDRMADASNRYLIDISPHITQEREFVKQSYLIKVLTCFERIGDHAINIADNVRKLDDHAGSFSESAMKELTVATDAVRDVLTITYDAFMHTDVKLAAKVEPMEEVIDALRAVVLKRIMNLRIRKGSPCPSCLSFGGVCAFWDGLISVRHQTNRCQQLTQHRTWGSLPFKLTWQPL